MKTTMSIPAILVSCCLLSVISCSSKEKEAETQPLLAPVAHSEKFLQQDIIAEKERQIAALERRLDAERDKTHRGKFGNLEARRKHVAESSRKIVNEGYAELRKAKDDLARLKASTTPEEFNRVEEELNRCIATLEKTVSTTLAE